MGLDTTTWAMHQVLSLLMLPSTLYVEESRPVKGGGGGQLYPSLHHHHHHNRHHHRHRQHHHHHHHIKHHCQLRAMLVVNSAQPLLGLQTRASMGVVCTIQITL